MQVEDPTPSLQILRAGREICLTLSEPPTYCTNKPQSSQNKVRSIFGCCVPCWRCQTSAERRRMRRFFHFYCPSYVRWRRICDLQANLNQIPRFGWRDMKDWSLTCCRLSWWTNRTSPCPSVDPSGVTGNKSEAKSCCIIEDTKPQIKIMRTIWPHMRWMQKKHTLVQLSWKCDMFNFRAVWRTLSVADMW